MNTYWDCLKCILDNSFDLVGHVGWGDGVAQNVKHDHVVIGQVLRTWLISASMSNFLRIRQQMHLFFSNLPEKQSMFSRLIELKSTKMKQGNKLIYSACDLFILYHPLEYPCTAIIQASRNISCGIKLQDYLSVPPMFEPKKPFQVHLVELFNDTMEAGQFFKFCEIQNLVLDDAILEEENPTMVHCLFHGPEPRWQGSPFSFTWALLEKCKL